MHSPALFHVPAVLKGLELKTRKARHALRDSVCRVPSSRDTAGPWFVRLLYLWSAVGVCEKQGLKFSGFTQTHLFLVLLCEISHPHFGCESPGSTAGFRLIWGSRDPLKWSCEPRVGAAEQW